MNPDLKLGNCLGQGGGVSLVDPDLKPENSLPLKQLQYTQGYTHKQNHVIYPL